MRRLTLERIASSATFTNPISSTLSLGSAIAALASYFIVFLEISTPGVAITFTLGLDAAQNITASASFIIPSKVSGLRTSAMTLVILLFLSKSSITNVFNLACSLSTISTFLLVTATTLIFFSNSARIVSPPVYPEAPNTTTLRGRR